MRQILFAGLLTAAALAQDGIRGPVPGFVFDNQSKSLRPMIGIPGASYLGGAIAGGLENASVAPNGKLALAVRDGRLGLLDLRGAEAQWNELAAAGSVRIAWSNNSSVAAIWHKDGRIDVLRNFQESPQVTALGAVEDVVALAVDAQGVVAAASTAGILRLREGRNPELLAPVNDPSGLALDESGNSLYAAIRGENAILEFADWRNSGGATLMANENAGIISPAALAVSADGRTIIVAGSTSLVMIDRATHAVMHTLNLDFKPSRLERLGDGGAYLLNSREQGQSLEILSGGPEAKVYFVPVEE